MTIDYDLVVLGAGNAGQSAAGITRKAGWKVAVVEGRDVGGTCALRGCVPKKVLVAAAEALDLINRASEHKINVGKASLDWPALIERKESFVSGVPFDVEKGLLSQGIEVIHGGAQFIGPNKVFVEGKELRARKLLIATGSIPRQLTMNGFEHTITSDELLELERLPESIVFLGAGVIALEFAHVFARAGSRVTILHTGDRALSKLDKDAVDRLIEATREAGIEVLFQVELDSIQRQGEQYKVAFVHHGQSRALTTSVVANAAGRVAALESLNLSAAGITLNHGKPKIDKYLVSEENPDICFAGDANPYAPQLSPVATYEGRIVGNNLIEATKRSPDYSAIPNVVFTLPCLASVGLNEQQARARGLSFEVKINDMKAWRSARTYAEKHAYAKVLVERSSKKILGAHLLGHGAAETIHAFAFALKYRITADELRETVFAYPTFHSDLKFLV